MSNVSFSALKLLRRMIEVDTGMNDTIDNTMVAMALELEEAKVLTCKKDVNNAMCKAKLAVATLKHNQNNCSRASRKCLDVLQLEVKIPFSSWLSRTEIGSVTLTNFLIPTSEIAEKAANETKDNLEITRKLSRAYFILADYVANLFETVTLRVKSHEWKLAGMASTQRQVELEKCEEKCQEVKKRLVEPKHTLPGKVKEEEEGKENL